VVGTAGALVARVASSAVSGRIPLLQTDAWSRSIDAGGDPYDPGRCCVCHRPVITGDPRIWVTRTNDGEWWVVAPDAPVRHDERHLGDPHFTLPIGPDCLRRNPGYAIGRYRP
jgi:hypothetical protein